MRVIEDLPSERGTGRTTRQLQRAPRGAVFIWCNGDTGYPKALAMHLNRSDIEVRPPSVLEEGGRPLKGRELSALVLDHACHPSKEEYEALDNLRLRVIQQL